MEGLTEIVTAMLSLLFSETTKEGGRNLGKAVSEKLKKFKKLIKERLGKEEVKIEGSTQKELEEKIKELEKKILEVAYHDKEFSDSIISLFESIENISPEQSSIAQVVVEDTEVGGDANIQSQSQSKGGEASTSTKQAIVSGLKVAGNLSISNNNQSIN